MEEIITVNGMLYKLASPVPLTMEQRNSIIQNLSINTLSNTQIFTLANLAGVTVNIHILGSDTVFWTGISDSLGIARDTAGNKPSLPYNDYKAVGSKYGYTSGETTFNIPADAGKTLRITIINQQITITVTD